MSMRGVTVPSVARLLAVAAASLVLVGSAAATGASDTPAPPVARIHSASPDPATPPYASLAPHGAAGPMTFQQISTAAQTCAGYAAAGWANNGNYGGNLVTATAVCVAESGGNASIYYCDGNGTVGTYPPVTCPGGKHVPSAVTSDPTTRSPATPLLTRAATLWALSSSREIAAVRPKQCSETTP